MATIILAAITAALLFAKASPRAAVGCLLGAALMMINLSLLSLTVRGVLASAKRAGGVNTLGLLAAPLKMLFLIAVVYAVISSERVSLFGFTVGTLTQIAAIFIEVGRACWGQPLPLQPDR